MAMYEREREEMVNHLVRSGYLNDERAVEAMRKVPRRAFIPSEQRRNAYVDSPLPIGDGQTISAPHMVAIMVEAADLGPGMRVLEIGGGSGYHAAVMGEMVSPGGKVYTMERLESLAERARESLGKAGYGEVVEISVGDGTKGLPEKGPYDRIVVTAGAPDVPGPLKEQLAEGGKLLIPVGGRSYQELLRITRHGEGFTTENLGGCVFVPLIGEHGFPH
ncbi:MAG: protein-L-isoaspartate(D-aspartate) O-methyltransferase [Methanomassiliicoccales archaeon]